MGPDSVGMVAEKCKLNRLTIDPNPLTHFSASMSHLISRCGGCLTAASLFFAGHSRAADVVAGPGEAGLRAAITAAQNGDTVIVTNHVELQSSIQINKRITLRSNSADPNSGGIRGSFEGQLFQLTAEGIVFENIGLSGSPQTDGLRVEKDVLLRDCYISWLRAPVTIDYSSFPGPTVRLERCTVMFNETGLEAPVLEAKDTIFSFNGTGPFSHGGSGVGATTAFLDSCRFENNFGFGLVVAFGTVKNCTFRNNMGFGLWCDGDPGELSLSSSLFYANADGGLMVGEQVFATVDNCTFTRHTGSPAILVGGDASGALFRHCTVADNSFFESEPLPRQRIGSGAFTINRPVTLQNCLVADNPTNGSPHAASLVGSWIDGGGNIIGGPAQLNVLGQNGGPTLSMLPLSNSPAIDAGVRSDLVVDARGLSRLAGTAPDAGAVETDALPLADADVDGLPDLWEVFHGLNHGDPADAFSDTDRDGQTALVEFRSRTDPDDPQSALRFVEVRLTPAPLLQPYPRTAYFLWSYVFGVTYEVEISTDLREWRKAPGSYSAYGTLDGRPAMLFEARAESAMSFYRVRVKESPFN